VSAVPVESAENVVYVDAADKANAAKILAEGAVGVALEGSTKTR
jgi:hypothetical protein